MCVCWVWVLSEKNFWGGGTACISAWSCVCVCVWSCVCLSGASYRGGWVCCVCVSVTAEWEELLGRKDSVYFCVIMCVCDRVGVWSQLQSWARRTSGWKDSLRVSVCRGGKCPCRQAARSRESGPEQGKKWRLAWGVRAQAGCRQLLGAEAWAGVRRSSCRGRPTLRCLSSSGAGEIRLRGGHLVREDGAWEVWGGVQAEDTWVLMLEGLARGLRVWPGGGDPHVARGNSGFFFFFNEIIY